MLTARFYIGIALWLMVSIAGSVQVARGQQPLITDSTPAARDPQAIAVVQQSLAALGGINAIAAVHTVETSGQIIKAGSSSPLPFRWMEEVSGSHFEFRREAQDGSKTRVFASGHGKPGFGVVGHNGTELSVHMAIAAVPLETPAVVLYAELQDPTYAFNSVPSSGSDRLLHIRITNSSNFIMKALIKQDWYFDSQTLLPARFEYNLPSSTNALDSIRASCVYTNFEVEQGVMYPSRIQGFQQGREVSQVVVSSIQPNASISSSQFDIPLQNVHTGGLSK